MVVTSRLVIALFCLLAACATAPPPPEAPVADAGDPRIAALEAAIAAELAAAPGAAPRGLAVAVPAVEEAGAQIVFEARLEVPAAFARPARAFTVYASCEPARLEDCTRKVMDAARAVDRLETGGRR